MLVDCIVALPGQLCYTTQIPVCLWFLARDRSAAGGFRDRRGEVLFIDARSVGQLVTRVYRGLTEREIGRIATTYHAWRGESEAGEYADVPGFCRAAPTDEVREHDFVLTPGRFVQAGADSPLDPARPSIEELAERLREELRAAAIAADLVIAQIDRL